MDCKKEVYSVWIAVNQGELLIVLKVKVQKNKVNQCHEVKFNVVKCEVRIEKNASLNNEIGLKFLHFGKSN